MPKTGSLIGQLAFDSTIGSKALDGGCIDVARKQRRISYTEELSTPTDPTGVVLLGDNLLVSDSEINERNPPSLMTSISGSGLHCDVTEKTMTPVSPGSNSIFDGLPADGGDDVAGITYDLSSLSADVEGMEYRASSDMLPIIDPCNAFDL